MNAATKVQSGQIAPQYTECKTWQTIVYPLIPTLNNLFMILFMLNAYIANGGYGLAMSVAGIIASYAKIFDAVTDPLIAAQAYKVRTRLGAARPLIITGFLIEAASVIGIMFIFQGMGMLPYIICYFGYVLGSTILNQGKNIASNIITNHPRQRPLIARATSIYTIVLSMLFSLYSTKILYPKYGKINFQMLQECSVTVILSGAIFLLLGCYALNKVDTQENINRNYRTGMKITLMDAWRLIRENRAVLAIVIADSTDKLAAQASSASTIITLLFGVLIGNYGFSGDISIINSLITIVLIFMTTGLARCVGAAKSYLFFTKISIFVTILMFLFMLTGQYVNISTAFVPTIIFIALNSLISGAKSATNSCVITMYQDVSDYEFYRTGKYMPGMVIATITMAGKVVSSLAATIVGFSLTAIGYVTTSPQPGDPITPGVFWVTMTMWLGFLVLGWAASIIALKFYPLTGEKMAEVQAVNAQRRAENAAAAQKG